MPEVEVRLRRINFNKKTQAVLLYSLTDVWFLMHKIPGIYIRDGANPAEAGHNFRHFRHFSVLQALYDCRITVFINNLKLFLLSLTCRSRYKSKVWWRIQNFDAFSAVGTVKTSTIFLNPDGRLQSLNHKRHNLLKTNDFYYKTIFNPEFCIVTRYWRRTCRVYERNAIGNRGNK